MASSSSTSPCAACKFLRRKCQPECVFAPYFPPDQPTKFANVHKVFGASNVTKLLNDLHPNQREDAVNSLAYEADMRLRDPVYGCVGVISILQHQLRQLQIDLSFAKSELLRYQSVGLAAHHQHHGSIMGGSFGRDHHVHQPQLMIRSNYVDGHTEALPRNMGAYDAAGMLAVNVPSTGGIRQLGSTFSPQPRVAGDEGRNVNMGPS